MMNEIKCNRCAEFRDCYKGQNGGKPNCPCFSPSGRTVRDLKHIIDTGLTFEEMELLAQADEILHRLQNDLGNQLNMMSIETGEVISTNELARVRGIIGALSEYRGWQLSINERAGF